MTDTAIKVLSSRDEDQVGSKLYCRKDIEPESKFTDVKIYGNSLVLAEQSGTIRELLLEAREQNDGSLEALLTEVANV